jgi:hypothetical protein
MTEMRNAYKIIVEKLEMMGQLEIFGRLVSRQVYNIKINLLRTVTEGADWIQPARQWALAHIH